MEKGLEAALCGTSLSDLRDSDLLTWLRETEHWLSVFRNGQYTTNIIGVLSSFPWVRLTPADAKRKTTKKIMTMFERVCCQLIDVSPMAVPAVLETAFRPFHTIVTSSQTVNAIPISNIARIVNHVATVHPQTVADLFQRCLAPMSPMRRWPYVFHHTAYMSMILNLALDVRISDSSELAVPDQDDVFNQTSKSGAVVAAALPAKSEEGSDMCSTAAALDTAGATLQLSGANRMIMHQTRLIGLVLSKLLDMELSIEKEDFDENDGPAANKRRRTEPPSQASFIEGTNLHCSPLVVLRESALTLFRRLQSDVQHRRYIESSERPPWWTELMVFHCECVAKIKRPVVAHLLAPQIALMGSSGEAHDLIHRVVSLVLKGHLEPRPSQVLERTAHHQGKMSAPFQHKSLSSKQRIQAAAHVSPLLSLLANCVTPDLNEGILRRMFKFVGSKEGASVDDVSQAVFIQALALGKALGSKINEKDDIPAPALEIAATKMGLSVPVDHRALTEHAVKQAQTNFYNNIDTFA